MVYDVTIVAFLTVSREVVIRLCVATLGTFALCSEGVLTHG